MESNSPVDLILLHAMAKHLFVDHQSLKWPNALWRKIRGPFLLSKSFQCFSEWHIYFVSDEKAIKLDAKDDLVNDVMSL